jgi:hypothetical protein
MFYARVAASAAGCPSRWLHPPRGFATPGTPPAAPSTQFNVDAPPFVTAKSWSAWPRGVRERVGCVRAHGS